MVGMASTGPGGSRWRSRPRASCRTSAAQPSSASGVAAPSSNPRATEKAKRGLSRSIHARKVFQASTGCSVRCARPQVTIPGGASTSSRQSGMRRFSRSSMSPRAAAVAGSAKPKVSIAMISFEGSAEGTSSPRSTAETRAKTSASRANQPAVSDSAPGQHPGQVEAPVCGPDAVEAAEAGRHAYGATRIGAERRVA